MILRDPYLFMYKEFVSWVPSFPCSLAMVSVVHLTIHCSSWSSFLIITGPLEWSCGVPLELWRTRTQCEFSHIHFIMGLVSRAGRVVEVVLSMAHPSLWREVDSALALQKLESHFLETGGQKYPWVLQVQWVSKQEQLWVFKMCLCLGAAFFLPTSEHWLL